MGKKCFQQDENHLKVQNKMMKLMKDPFLNENLGGYKTSTF